MVWPIARQLGLTTLGPDGRRIATRYDGLARNFLAAVLMIGTLYWIKL